MDSAQWDVLDTRTIDAATLLRTMQTDRALQNCGPLSEFTVACLSSTDTLQAADIAGHFPQLSTGQYRIGLLIEMQFIFTETMERFIVSPNLLDNTRLFLQRVQLNSR